MCRAYSVELWHNYVEQRAHDNESLEYKTHSMEKSRFAADPPPTRFSLSFHWQHKHINFSWLAVFLTVYFKPLDSRRISGILGCSKRSTLMAKLRSKISWKATKNGRTNEQDTVRQAR